MTIYTYTSDYQSGACNKAWYDALLNGELPGEHETTVALTSVSTSQSTPTLVDRALITNLFCKGEYSHTVDGSPVSDSVYQLIDATLTDEIDPRMINTPIPNAVISFYSTFNDLTDETEIQELVAKIESSLLRIYRGYATTDGALYDENGLPALYYTDYTHDVMCMGTYIPVEVSYDYQSHNISIECEHVGFHTLAGATEMATDSYYNQRYPFPFGVYKYKSNGKYSIGNRISYKLGYTPKELFSAFDHSLPDFGNVKTTGKSASGNYGIDFSNISYVTYTSGEGQDSSQPEYQAYKSEQAIQAIATVSSTGLSFLSDYDTFTFDDVAESDGYELTNLMNTWQGETMYEMFASWLRQNNLYLLPKNDANGCWHIVGGENPSRDKVFDGPRADSPSNGIWRQYLQGVSYDVMPSMIRQSSLIKSKLELEKYNYVTQWRAPMIPLFSGSSGDNQIQVTTMQAPKKSYTSTRDDATFPIPGNSNLGLDCDEYALPRDNKWYTESSSFKSATAITNGVSNSAADDLMGHIEVGVRNGCYRMPKALFSAGFTNNPFKDGGDISVELLYYEPSSFVVDINDVSVGENTTDDSLDDVHLYFGTKGVTKRVLDRVNGDTLAPLYQVEWGMNDDPSLRVGTVVRVPMQNKWVYAYIYKQERSFTGGTELKNYAWVIEETNEPVYSWDLNMLNIKLYYLVKQNRIVCAFEVPDSFMEWGGIPPISFTLLEGDTALGNAAPSFEYDRTIGASYSEGTVSFEDQDFYLRTNAFITGDTNSQLITDKIIVDVENDHPRLGEIVLSEEEEPLMAPDHLLRG